MTAKAAPHPLSEQRFLGTLRPLPRILFCHIPAPSLASDRTRWCGRLWTANNPAEYAQQVKAREAHHRLCAALADTRG